MDIGKSFSFVTADKDWVKKVAIGGVVSIVPIVNLMAIGYGIRVLRNVAEDRANPLPEWDDWGGDFMKGLLVALASLVYALPAMLVSGIVAAIAAMAENSSGDAQGVVALFTVALNCIVGLWSLAVGLWVPGAMVNFADKATFGSMFEFKRIWELITENLGNYFTAIVVMVLAGIAGSLGFIACIIGVIFTKFYASMVGMHALGQFAHEAGAIAGSTALSAEPSLPALDEPLFDEPAEPKPEL
jgi:hypothetical protein